MGDSKMNISETKNNMIKEWLRLNYSTSALEWHLKRYGKEELQDFPYFARSWKGETDLE